MNYDIRQEQIINAISSELSLQSESIDFKVIERQQIDKQLWSLIVEPTEPENRNNYRRYGLDESLEGAKAWWAEPIKGAADVLSVIPDKQRIDLRFTTTDPPLYGSIKVYLPRYLESLEKYWKSREAIESLNYLDSLIKGLYSNTATVTIEPRFTTLREKQRRAYRLLGNRASFLWGPPGTGKTYTIGALIADYIISYPNHKILIISTTNSAVDLALISVDKGLDELSNKILSATGIRNNCKRIGNHFKASNYETRKHLIPTGNDEFIKELVQHEKNRPNKSNTEIYAKWKMQEEQIRGRININSIDVIKSSQISAMTSTSATFMLDKLMYSLSFDLLVFDEASQVSVAHALALAPLSKSIIYAGDPKQIAPIVQSRKYYENYWLGRSMFEYMDERRDSTVMLDEQSRMAEPICKLVSDTFYNGKLIVAHECKNAPKWLAERKIKKIEPHLESEHTQIIGIGNDGIWSRKYGGYIRWDSAEIVKDIVKSICDANEDVKNILVITPFRAQRTLIRQKLSILGKPYDYCNVSTVHRSQGSECHTVIFDPVNAQKYTSWQQEDAQKLINVALSRAMARLILIMSDNDRNCQVFNSISRFISKSYNYPTYIEGKVEIVSPIKQGKSQFTDSNHITPSQCVDITKFVELDNFPYNCEGKFVKIVSTSDNCIIYGKVKQILEGGKYIQLSGDSGDKKFDVQCLKEIAKAKKNNTSSFTDRKSLSNNGDLHWADLCRELIKRNISPFNSRWESLKVEYACKKNLPIPSDNVVKREIELLLQSNREIVKIIKSRK